jgi:Cu-processing system ATP-binding protein
VKLSVEGISVRFGPVLALSGIDLEFPKGEVDVLAGPNGAGKSTLMAVMLGLVEPDTGRLLVDGEDLVRAGARAHRRFRERLGYLPEAVAFAENLNGREVMRFFARARGVGRARVDEVLEQVGLKDAARRAVRGYSRGMRQRLGLGVAILHEPELLILDEPTGGLDQQGLTLLWQVLDEWRTSGRRVLLSTHDLALIERRADRVHVLSSGRLKASGTPDALRRLAGLAIRVRVAMEDMTHAESLAGALSQDLSVPVDLGDGEIGLSIPSDSVFSVIRAMDARGVAGVRVEEPGLDAVYERLLEAP